MAPRTNGIRRVLGVASVILLAGLAVSPATASATVAPSCPTSDTALQHMHSHNDYGYSNTPLCSALAAGATSAEADVWANSTTKQLDVKHKPDDPAEGTLEDLYLKPLWELYSERDAKWVYPEWHRPLTLVVELKDDDTNDALDDLQDELRTYLPMLSTVENGQVHENMVTVLLTGHADKNSVRQSPVQDTFVNLTDNQFLGGYVDGTLPALSVAPLVNVPWCDVEGYLKAHVPGYQTVVPGCADTPEQEAWHYLDGQNLQSYSAIAHELASLAHSRGLKIRWWGVPDQTGSSADASYLTNELLNDLDYVSADSSEDVTTPSGIDAVATTLRGLGDGCSGATECALGAKADVTVHSSGSQLQVTGTLWALDAGQCASLDVTFLQPSHLAERTVHVPQVCGTTPKPWGITVPGAPDSYAAVGTDLHSSETTHGGTQTTHDFYYVSSAGPNAGQGELTGTTPTGLACASGDSALNYSYTVDTTSGATVDGLLCRDHVTTGDYWAVQVADTVADGKCAHGVASWYHENGSRYDDLGMYVCGFGNVAYFDSPVRNQTSYLSTELGAFVDAGPSSYAPSYSF